MSITTMTSKGRITIPADIRNALHLKPGDTVLFQLEENGTVRISPYPRKVADVYGILARAGRRPLSIGEHDTMPC